MVSKQNDSSASTKGPLQILVVDDEVALRDGFRLLFESLGYRMIGVGTIAEGLAAVSSCHCVILDLNLAEGRGTALLEHVRTHQLPIPVALYSGNSEDATLPEVLQLQPSAFFRKGIDLKPLLAWVDAIDSSRNAT